MSSNITTTHSYAWLRLHFALCAPWSSQLSYLEDDRTQGSILIKDISGVEEADPQPGKLTSIRYRYKYVKACYSIYEKFTNKGYSIIINLAFKLAYNYRYIIITLNKL